MIKNIVFDMGGVILDYNINKTLDEYFPEEYHDILRDRVFMNKIWSDMDNGLTTYDEVIPWLLPQLPEAVRPLVKEMLTSFYPYMTPFDDMYEFIKRVKSAGYNVYLLSNATARFFDVYLNVPALTLMDGYFISALYKMLKPNEEIYEAFCNKFSVKPEECFFIDDMPANINGAKAYGMSGHVFKAHDIKALEESLKDAGVIL